jgi:hypothetical protein
MNPLYDFEMIFYLARYDEFMMAIWILNKGANRVCIDEALIPANIKLMILV